MNCTSIADNCRVTKFALSIAYSGRPYALDRRVFSMKPTLMVPEAAKLLMAMSVEQCRYLITITEIEVGLRASLISIAKTAMAIVVRRLQYRALSWMSCTHVHLVHAGRETDH